MKKQITLDIPKPCGEKWSTFTPTATGGFCVSCQKNVIDFTKMTDEEIQQFFLNKPQYACGRFHPDQLKTYSITSIPKNKFGWKLLKAGFISLSLLLLNKKESLAQSSSKIEVIGQEEEYKNQQSGDTTNSFSVKGIVMSEVDNEPLPGVYIFNGEIQETAITDLDGNFELKNVKAGDVITFSYIGFKEEKYKIPKQVDSELINVTLKNVFLVLNAELLGEVAISEVYSEKSLFGKLGDKFKNIFN
ncbi:carboxypeptidase-like regulatory domain-containing protein [Chondrinema litorale]|uniref:carboxypeptidase-like regulatory domain-containing protein n=1 Tax=Chondrinema litorale TaxID=2994555 RepID=UPI0025437D71|nr:carboxypeptidase-like regulatory domain-containing protein [Chondrinema litorale]UZR96601.1 carboxypeptidase-like regulatory domain-containing protein [Chondrinema litorale]